MLALGFLLGAVFCFFFLAITGYYGSDPPLWLFLVMVLTLCTIGYFSI